MKMRPIILLVLLFSATSGVSREQVNQAQANEPTRLFETPRCRRNSQSEQMVCETVLPGSMGTKRNKAGDHIFVRTNLVTSSAEEPITMLDAAIVEVQSKVKAHHFVLRLRIDKAVRKDGSDLPVEATVVALASQSVVTEGWDFPGIIADRFPRIPEDDQRLPGERKLSEDRPHTSSLDSMPNLPVHLRLVCPEKTKKSQGRPCVDLLEARGIYGYKTVTLEPVDPTSPAESVLTSKKNILIRAGTVLVIEVKNIQRPL
jgi:hypothetical protein